MTSAQLILVSVTSALVAVFAMLLVATIKRARARDDLTKTDVTKTDIPKGDVATSAPEGEKEEGSS